MQSFHCCHLLWMWCLSSAMCSSCFSFENIHAMSFLSFSFCPISVFVSILSRHLCFHESCFRCSFHVHSLLPFDVWCPPHPPRNKHTHSSSPQKNRCLSVDELIPLRNPMMCQRHKSRQEFFVKCCHPNHPPSSSSSNASSSLFSTSSSVKESPYLCNNITIDDSQLPPPATSFTHIPGSSSGEDDKYDREINLESSSSFFFSPSLYLYPRIYPYFATGCFTSSSIDLIFLFVYIIAWSLSSFFAHVYTLNYLLDCMTNKQFIIINIC